MLRNDTLPEDRPRIRRDAFRVKRKTLAAEIRIIRAEEQALTRKIRTAKTITALEELNGSGKSKAKAKRLNSLNARRLDLYFHRIFHVRAQARISHLAHTFLCGRLYRTAERGEPRNPPGAETLKSILADVKRFGGDGYSGLTVKDMLAWVEGDSPTAILFLDSEVGGPGSGSGTEGQDRKSYTDVQDREAYTV